MDVMLDIESLGTKPGSVVLNIGAVAFDPVSGVFGPDFKVHIDVAESLSRGFTIDASTVEWWMQQGPEARAASFGADLKKETLFSALVDFTTFFRVTAAAKNVWSHGPAMDAVCLEAAYRNIGASAPWSYRDVRCTRTIYDLAGVEPDRSTGTYHDSLVDARNQALAVIKAYKVLGKS